MPEGRAGKYFTWAEFETSTTAMRLGIDNTVPEGNVAKNIASLCERVLDPLREAVSQSVRITSGYRSPETNKAMKATSPTSQHTLGEAADVKVSGWAALDLLTKVRDLGLVVDQGIAYHPLLGGHTHLAHVRDRRANRGQLLYAYRAGGGREFWPLRTEEDWQRARADEARVS